MTSTHGSGVTEAAQSIAPESPIFAFDTMGYNNKHIRSMSNPESVVVWHSKSFEHGVDVINLSRRLEDTPEIVASCQEAIRKGIAIFVSAGNDLVGGMHIALMKSGVKKRKISLETLNKIYLINWGERVFNFVGAVKYDENGEDKVLLSIVARVLGIDCYFFFTIFVIFDSPYKINYPFPPVIK